ncbi:MAG TPA: M15 family metallopeptidase [Solirubrobacterales bacterium]|nr:M15 family metallopeptidase [Solirubrobacterales bacterium]
MVPNRNRRRLAAFALPVLLCLALTTAPAASAGFRGHASPLDPALRQRMTGVSWHPGCPVGLDDLRLLAVTYWGFDGDAHFGRLVVNRDAARPLLTVMRRLYRLHYPFRRMQLVDAYGADDHRSMEADNTSAFDCRFVSGTSRWSQHAYGRAIDVNPIENPYADSDGYVSPPQGAPFADRTQHAKGLIHRGGHVVRAFAAIGWGWGGDWNWPKDFQHFSATGT